MKNFIPSEVWGTALRNNIFVKTRLRLTFFYIAIIAVILFIFSQILFLTFSNNIKKEHHPHDYDDICEQQATLWAQDARAELATILMLVNGGILIVSGALSYFLAGKTMAPIQETLEKQKQFISDASHELRTPIAILKTNMEVELADTGIKGERKKNLKSNLTEVNQMADLVNDLLLLSRIDSDDLKSSFEVFSITPLVEEAVERMKRYAKTKSVTVAFHKTTQNQFVKGDRGMLTSALINLIKNAIDYNTKNGKVVVSVKAVNQSCAITVNDTGIGIAKEEIENVFERFYRVDKSRTSHTASSGTGLGLAIVQAVVHEHGGKLSIKSELKKGTTVTISLPLIKSS